MTLLELRGVERWFQQGETRQRVLQGIDLRIEAGEMVALVGQSGSGKSTLMNILGCLDRANAGRYMLDGVDVQSLSPEERARLRRERFGFIFQRYHLLSDLNALENVSLPAIYAGQPRPDYEARSQALLQRLGLGQRLRHRPAQLSGGQQQRVSIARALMNGGQIILADEPTGALDSHSGAEVMRILRELHRAGHTVLLVTHAPEVAAQADRIIEIKDGCIIADRRQREALPGMPPAALSFQKNRWGRWRAAASMALRALWGHRLRSALTMLGIVIGIASVVCVMALGRGSQQQVLEQISDLGSNTIEIFAGKFGDRRAHLIRTLVPADGEILAQQDFIDSATPLLRSSAMVQAQGEALQGSVTGVGAQFFQVQNLPLVAGRGFRAQDMEDYAAIAILDQASAARLFPGESALGQVLRLNRVPVRIVGIVDSSKSNRFGNSNQAQVFLPYTAAMNRLLGRSHISSIMLRIRDGVDAASAEDAIRRILIQRHGREDFSLFNSDSLRKTIESTSASLAFLIAAIAAIALVVGGIGVMNIMLVAVTERTQEIGIRMAVGARPGDIMLQFLIEALVLCLLGGLLGVALAFAAGALLQWFNAGQHRLIYSASSVLLAFACAAGMGLLFGFLPARRAAQLDPVEALSRD